MATVASPTYTNLCLELNNWQKISYFRGIDSPNCTNKSPLIEYDKNASNLIHDIMKNSTNIVLASLCKLFEASPGIFVLWLLEPKYKFSVLDSILKLADKYHDGVLLYTIAFLYNSLIEKYPWMLIYLDEPLVAEKLHNMQLTIKNEQLSPLLHCILNGWSKEFKNELRDADLKEFSEIYLTVYNIRL